MPVRYRMFKTGGVPVRYRMFKTGEVEVQSYQELRIGKDHIVLDITYPGYYLNQVE